MEEEEEEGEQAKKARVNSHIQARTHTHNNRSPCFHSKDHLWLEMDECCVCSKTFLFSFLCLPEWAEQRGGGNEKKREAGVKGPASTSYQLLLFFPLKREDRR